MKQEQDVKEPGRNMKKVQIKSTEVGATVIDGTKECIDEIKEHNCICYRLRPKNDFSGTYIVYFYGSGMCKSICDEQWKFIINTAKAIGAGFFVPMYPLTPEHTCHELFDMLEPAYANFSSLSLPLLLFCNG